MLLNMHYCTVLVFLVTENVSGFSLGRLLCISVQAPHLLLPSSKGVVHSIFYHDERLSECQKDVKKAHYYQY